MGPALLVIVALAAGIIAGRCCDENNETVRVVVGGQVALSIFGIGAAVMTGLWQPLICLAIIPLGALLVGTGWMQ